MRVILLQDVENVGKKYEIKEVKAGFARNFLFAKNLAKPVTKEALKWLDMQKEIMATKEESDLKKNQELASAIDGQEVVVPVVVGEKDQLFASINAQKISEKLKELGFDVRKNQIDLDQPIKEIGEFPVKIKFEHNLEAEIKVIVTEKK